MSRWTLMATLFSIAVASPQPAFGATPAEVYAKSCGACHGGAGRPDPRLATRLKLPDFTQPSWQKSRSDAEIRRAIAEGVSGTTMRAWKGDLSDAEIAGQVRHIRSLKAN